MDCPPIQRCVNPDCWQLLIHRGKRSQHESSSYFGQIVHNICDKQMAAIDIDLCIWRRSKRLLRFIEHKSPGQRLDRGSGQREVLELLAGIIEHLKTCPSAVDAFRLRADSGVFRVDGDPHEANWLGPATIINLLPGSVDDPLQFEDEIDTLCWVGLPEQHQRRAMEFALRKRGRRPAGTAMPAKFIADQLIRYRNPAELALIAGLLTEALGDAA